ncbi:MAG: hypothetical protein U1F65_01545 [Verrucomicrobiota bacterium]
MLSKIIHATVLGALLTVTGLQAAPALPKSPVFTNGVAAWDCLITGDKGERGIIFLTFSTNINSFGHYSFNVQQIHTKVATSTSKVKVTTTNAPADRGSTTPGRGDPETTTNTNETTTSTNAVTTTKTTTNIFGFWSTEGSWGFDYKGNVLGIFYEVVAIGGSGTNLTLVTNQVSFIGKATPNKRFTALFYSSVGGLGKYSGVPLKVVTNRVNGAADLSGPWTGNEIAGSLNTVELFNLIPGGFPNFYLVDGEGPSYASVGFCMASSQKKIAFSNNQIPEVQGLRATYGDLINTASVLGSKGKGLVGTGSNLVYNAYFVPYSPYP